MNNKMYNLIQKNYTELFSYYCKNWKKNKISNSNSVEDRFNSKILQFMELNIQDPTLEMLILFLKTKRNDQQLVKSNYSLTFIENVSSLPEDILNNYNRNIKNDVDSYTEYCKEYNKVEIEFNEKLNLLFVDYRPAEIKRIKKK